MILRLSLSALACTMVMAFCAASLAYVYKEGGSISGLPQTTALSSPQPETAPVVNNDSAKAVPPSIRPPETSIPIRASDTAPAPLTATPNYSAGTFLTLCYHNVEDNDPDQTFVGVTTSRLIEQLGWLKYNGYHPVSIDDILAARNGGKPLPDKAVLLTFDDGYESFYNRVYPVLQAYHFPAVLAVVDAWLEAGRPDDTVEYGDYKMERKEFLTWDQIREMSKSGLVEIASHTHNLHRGILANPQGNSEPAAVTREYDPKTNTYETEAAYEARLRADAQYSVNKIEQEIGHKPRVMVWPYGQYNQVAADIQAEQGMTITLTLDDGFGLVNSLGAVPRYLINADPDMEGFVVEMRDMLKPQPVRVVHVDLDYVYDKDPVQEAKNLDALVSRVHDMKITTVFLQAYADPEGSGFVKEVYFPNRHLPVRQDLFNRVAWQLETRAQVKVYAWMPVLSYNFGEATPVVAWDPKTGQTAPDAKAYHRLSMFDPTARRMIADMYEDLARFGPIDGILFHDDAMLSDFEDASAPALAAYAKAGLPASIAEIRANPETMKRWTEFKTQELIKFTRLLAAHARRFRAPLMTARNIYAPVILTPQSQEWFAQDYKQMLAAYDYVAVEAMPYMENVPSGKMDDWFKQLVGAVAKQNGLQHTIFELQALDWRKKQGDSDRRIPTKTLAAQMRLLERMGALSLGYYPDDFLNDQPNAKEIHKDFTIQTYPYLQ